jgi:spermidine synthase
MKYERRLAETTIPNGAKLALFEHDGTFAFRLNGQTLMHTAMTASEQLLGELAVASLTDHPAPRILIGGLGLGFSLQSVLAKTRPAAIVHVAELISSVVDWNREFLGEVHGKFLADPRVTVYIEDVWNVLSRNAQNARDHYDAVLLDVDNGPSAMVQKPNTRLYTDKGIRLVQTALNPGGRAAIWSAGPDRAFAERLFEAGFRVESIPALLYPKAKRAGCTIFIADKAP